MVTRASILAAGKISKIGNTLRGRVRNTKYLTVERSLIDYFRTDVGAAASHKSPALSTGSGQPRAPDNDHFRDRLQFCRRLRRL